MDINSTLEKEFRVTIIQAMATLENTTSSNIESLRVEIRVDLAILINPINEIQSNLNTLTARVTEAEDRTRYLEVKQIEKMDQEKA